MLLTRATAMAVLFLTGTCLAQSTKTGTATSAQKTTEQAFKNIQVLKGIPADELIPSMQIITVSLGVQCDFCHVEGAFDKDDKAPKKTARKMISMMFAINKDNFDGNKNVTCYACHRGARKPVAVPMISDESAAVPSMPESTTKDEGKPSLPDPDAILARYMRALGSGDLKTTARLQKGTMAVGAAHLPVEVLTKGPENRITTVHFPAGENVTGYNPQVGWLSSPGRGTHHMSAAELDAARLDADPQFAVDLRKVFPKFESRPAEKIDGHPTNVVAGLRGNYPAVELYFDQESGLLVRLKRYIDTPLGLNPAQIDYGDYRDMDGVKIPFRWTIARPSGRFTIQIDQIDQDVPADDAKFAEPPEPAKPSH